MAGARWTTEQVLALAPDAASVKAARTLTRVATWSDLGCTESLVFGRCQGSGSTPYQVTVDLAEPAFRCSCPSRKHPCKHGLALLLLWVDHGDAVAEVVGAADFAQEWQGERRARAAATRTRREAPVDAEARARRQAEREATMTEGLDDLERWLGDVVRGGLAAVRRQPYAFWDGAAARLVDAQVPGLADRVRDAAGLVGRTDWADVLLAEMGAWQLAIDAWRHRAALAPATFGDLRVYLGWPWRADEVAAFATAADRWVVAGVREDTDGRIASQRTWLWGEASRRWVVLLDFAAAGAALRVPQVVGTVVEDALRLHPGSGPVRAALSGDEQVVGTGATPPGRSVDAALDEVAAALAADPWRRRMPVALAEVALAEVDDRWWLVDDAGDRLPLAAGVEPWSALALTGGAPATVTAEWDAGALHLLAVAAAGRAVVPL